MDTKLIRERVLSLAIRGKLVPQLASEEPASVLLDRIREERAQLVKEKKMKPPKQESLIFRGEDGFFYERVGKSVKCIQEEIPFEIPSSWEWVRLGEVAEYKKGPFGSSITKSMFVPESENTLKVYEQKNAIKKDASLGNYYITEEKFRTLKNFSLRPKDIIVSCAGTIGETYVMPDNMKKGIINQALMLVRLYDVSISKFYLAYFKSVLEEEAKLNSKGSAIKNIPPFSIFKKFLFPLPPLEEQHRIVRAIEGILSHVDEIEENQLAIEADFKLLKEKALDLAIQGKLTKQDPADEPASELLKRIKAEKEALIKAKKIKKDKLESIIFRRDNSHYEKIGEIERCIDDEIPFYIPDSWEWARLSTLGTLQTGTTPSTDNLDYFNGEIPFIKPADISNENIDYCNETLTKMGVDKSRLISKNSVLMVCIGGSIGKCAINIIDVCCNQQINAITPYLCNVKYFMYVMCSKYFLSYMKSNTGGTATPICNKSMWGKLLIPITPLNEQERIAKKLKQIFKSIENL